MPTLGRERALMDAAYRARAGRRPAPILKDPWAVAIAGEEGKKLAWANDHEHPRSELWVSVRAAFFDRQLQRYLRPGSPITQVVILGSGSCTRAARFRRKGVKFFEIGHPDWLVEKQAVLSQLNGYPTEQIAWVGCDLFEDDVGDALQAHNYWVGQPTVVLAEGSLPLLREPRIEQILSPLGLGMHGGSVLMFDYISAGLRRGAGRRADDRAVSRVVEQVDPNARWGTEDPLPVLYRANFQHVRTITFDQARLSLLGTYDPQEAVRFRAFAVATGTLGS